MKLNSLAVICHDCHHHSYLEHNSDDHLEQTREYSAAAGGRSEERVGINILKSITLIASK
jgi:hypothetical protein